MTEEKAACTHRFGQRNRVVEDVVLDSWPVRSFPSICTFNALVSREKLAPTLGPSRTGQKTPQAPHGSMNGASTKEQLHRELLTSNH